MINFKFIKVNNEDIPFRDNPVYFGVGKWSVHLLSSYHSIGGSFILVNKQEQASVIHEYIYHFLMMLSFSSAQEKYIAQFCAAEVESAQLCLFCCFTAQVNSYGHCGTVSSPNHTFPGQA